MRIRLGCTDDIAVLQAIERAGDQQFVAAGHAEFGGGEVIATDAAQVSIDAGRLFVAELDADPPPVVVGWLQLGWCGDEFEVSQIAVAPSHQQRGIGRRLMNVAFDEARRIGAATVVLDTQSDIVWNQPWYESLGFGVVSPDDWSEAMAAVTERQSAAGLDWSTRVHMRCRV